MIRFATGTLVILHLGLLLATLSDYRVSVDAAYHVSMGREYAEHFLYFWDHIHYQPGGRPNLQGPLVHFVIGMLGRVLGGSADDYVLANAILGTACWLFGVFTVFFFSRAYGTDRAALLAVAVFTGSVWGSGSFYVNLPSGWLFVLTPWAIHFFLKGRLLWAVLATTLACYSHLGGFATAPMGLVLAAFLASQWRHLMTVAMGAALLTSPYWIHFLLSINSYVGITNESAWMIDPLANLFGVAGLLAVLRSPRNHAFLVAWAVAPIAWLFQDTGRFLVHSSLAGAALGGIAIGGYLEQRRGSALCTAGTVLLVLLATFFPLGPPGLGAEFTWLTTRFPRPLDWKEIESISSVIRDKGLDKRLIYGTYGSGLSLWADARIEGGHWKEVQPSTKPAKDIRVGDRAYVLPLSPEDLLLRDWQGRGFLTVHGGGRWTSVVTFERRLSVKRAVHTRNLAWQSEAQWFASHCEHIAPGDWFAVFTDPAEIPRQRTAREQCRTPVGRIEAALLLWAYALEPHKWELSRNVHDCAKGLIKLAAIVGNESIAEYRTPAWHQQMREKMEALASAAREFPHSAERMLYDVVDHVYGERRGTLLGDPTQRTEKGKCGTIGSRNKDPIASRPVRDS